MFIHDTVRDTAEARRIRALPRRTWSDDTARAAAEYFTAAFALVPGVALRPIQGVALAEIERCQGLFGAIGVGRGKTLISLLAPAVLRLRRPILLLPAALAHKTRVELIDLSRSWRIPRNIELVSYQALGRVGQADWLETNRPDGIICDEAHLLKNPKAAVTRRVERYMREAPSVRFCAMSGTMYGKSLTEFAHIAEWALGEGSPVPRNHEISEWAAALDEGGNARHLDRVTHPGAILSLGSYTPQIDEKEAAREAFRDRFSSTPGVVVSSGDDGVNSSLYIRAIVHKVNAATEANFTKLRTEWETPDEWPLSMAMDVWRHARELALGFHYIWDPRPPKEWLRARKAWAAFVRRTISESRSYDSELQIRTAVEHRQLADEVIETPYGHQQCMQCDRTTLAHWKHTQPMFSIQPKAVWHDDGALNECATWIKAHRGIVWTEHSYFARELSRRTGAPYFGEQGVDARGVSIETVARQSHPPAIIASIRANSAGRNLQAWHSNLITSCPTLGKDLEQLIARTHRPGQLADTVTIDVLVGCHEQHEAMINAIALSRATQGMFGSSQKLLIADIDWPDGDMLPLSEHRFRPTKG